MLLDTFYGTKQLFGHCLKIMAAPIEEADSNTEKRESEVLDVSSSTFDPLRALYSRSVQLPCPDILPLNNIAEYDSYSKGESVRQRREQERQDSKQQKSTHEKTVSNSTQKENRPKDGSLPGNIVNVSDVSGSGADSVTDKSDGKRKLHRNRRTVLTRMEGIHILAKDQYSPVCCYVIYQEIKFFTYQKQVQYNFLI